jgi:hypothetical protein
MITWIKCSDQLPDDETTVLIALADKDVYVGFRWQGEWLYLDGMPLSAGMVTHWAHLPAHPDEEGRMTSVQIALAAEVERLRADLELHKGALIAEQEHVETLEAELAAWDRVATHREFTGSNYRIECISLLAEREVPTLLEGLDKAIDAARKGEGGGTR